MVFLKVSSWKKVLRFDQVESSFYRTYEVTERIRPVAYRLVLPIELENIHDMFHVSMLCRYRSDPSVQIEVEIRPDMTYGEELVKILA